MTHHDPIIAYEEFDKAIDNLYTVGRYSEAAEKLKSESWKHPDFKYELDVYRIFCLDKMGEDHLVIESLRSGLDQGWFYGLEWPRWDRYRELSEWTGLLKKNKKNKAAAQKQAAPESQIHLPKEGSSPYPLFIVLHGDGAACSIKFFQHEWRPDALLSMGFAVAYFQSSQVSCTGGYHWTADYDRARKDIEALLNSILSTESIDPRRIYIGGFSGGSMASLNVMATGLPGLRGVLALCPNETTGVTRETVAAAAGSGIRLVLMDGELSGDQPWQDQLETWAKNEGMPIWREIIPGEGHNVPEDWDRILRDAALFLSGEPLDGRH